jgi:hypothetical protein
MDYSSDRIEIKNIPQLEVLGSGKCCRRYFYRFVSSLPAQDEINLQVKQLDYKFTYSKEVYDLPENISVYAFVSVERLNDRDAVFIISTDEPEEDAIFLYGSYRLPGKIEKMFSTIESIQGDPTEIWIKSHRKY